MVGRICSFGEQQNMSFRLISKSHPSHTFRISHTINVIASICTCQVEEEYNLGEDAVSVRFCCKMLISHDSRDEWMKKTSSSLIYFTAAAECFRHRSNLQLDFTLYSSICGIPLLFASHFQNILQPQTIKYEIFNKFFKNFFYQFHQVFFEAFLAVWTTH